MRRALLIVDVQNDFTEGGALGVTGGDAVASGVTAYLTEHADLYSLIVASRDWHSAEGDNGGHFSEHPDFVDTWPVHCVAESRGAEYHPEFDTSSVQEHLFKGQGTPDYSAFQAVTRSGEPAPELFVRYAITDIDVLGIATDYCVRASSLDALRGSYGVRVLQPLTAGVAAESSAAALAEIRLAGGEILSELPAPGEAQRMQG